MPAAAKTAKPAKSSPLTDWTGQLGLPDFTAVRDEDFAKAFDKALKAHKQEINDIVASKKKPTIENTLAALELAGRPLDRIASIFWAKAGANTNETIEKLDLEISPKFSRHYSAISMNEKLFERIDSLYRRRARLDLDTETLRVLELTWKGFVRSGAKLDKKGKKRLAAIDEELATLGTQFGQNVLADERNWALYLDKTDLTGLPASLVDAMAQAASSRGKEGGYAVTLSRSIYEPFMASSDRRDLRETVYNAFINRGQNGGDTDNSAIVKRTLELRAEKAKLLGYPTYAALKLDNTMAKTPAAVAGLLNPVWGKARDKANADEKQLAKLAAESGVNEQIKGWDWRYWQEKLRAKKFAFDEAELKPYLELENIIAACFDVAQRLFGLTFEEVKGVAGWHEDVRTFKVNKGKKQIAVFMADYFNRPSKRSGAWMSSLQSGYRLGEGSTPIIYNVMNSAKPAPGQPALLSMDEARTLFHEFGHALHGMLTDVTWPSVSGTSVSRDWVELPSQLYEHWLTTTPILEKHALHAQTGKPMPKALLKKLKDAQTFNAGFATTEFAASALMDMAYHELAEAPADPLVFEAETLARLQKPEAIPMRHRTPHFQHVFAGDGYSAGYYSYMWSEVLDADAFAAFEETGDVFDPKLAKKLAKYIYASGSSKDPEELYKAFRGKMPSPDAMMQKRGLA